MTGGNAMAQDGNGRWLILADDLTGAADCAIAFAKTGQGAVVTWGDTPQSRQAGDAAAAIAVDVDSRRFPAADAATRQVAALSAHYRPGMALYKKIDSTLRGQPAAELAATLSALKRLNGGLSPLAVVAPAFPATGRITIDGRVLVDGLDLEKTPLWARDHSYASALLPEVLASAGLTAEVICLDDVRAGAKAVRSHLTDAVRRGISAVVCDCAQIADLQIIAEASMPLVPNVVWVGSAGLASALAGQTGTGAPSPLPPIDTGRVPLMVVGSLAEASRLQAQTLVRSGRVSHVRVEPSVLMAGADGADWQAVVAAFGAAMNGPRPVLLEIGLADHPDLSQGAALAARLAEIIGHAVPRIGALVATGGETACAVLARLGVHAIRLFDEVEPGVPVGMTVGDVTMPVITKAGAFGDSGTLSRSLDLFL